MSLIKTQLYQSPVGILELGVIHDQLCLCNWLDKKNKHAIQRRLSKCFQASFTETPHPVSNAAIEQLDLYFMGQLKHFDLPLAFAGTPFQQQVWQTLLTIPYGETISYQQLAGKIKDKRASRAVANANAANALSILVPCHRVIGSSGQLTGYAGGLEAKDYLLKLERHPA